MSMTTEKKKKLRVAMAGQKTFNGLKEAFKDVDKTMGQLHNDYLVASSKAPGKGRR